MITDIYMFPCRGNSPTAQVDELIKDIPAHLYGKVWIDVETNPSSGCSWKGHDGASNCQFLTDIANKVKASGKDVGIYASETMWTSILGSRTAWLFMSSGILTMMEKNLLLTLLTSEAGLKTFMKQYQGDVSSCGAGIDKNFRP